MSTGGQPSCVAQAIVSSVTSCSDAETDVFVGGRPRERCAIDTNGLSGALLETLERDATVAHLDVIERDK